MKRFLKKGFCLLTVIMLTLTVCVMSACEKIKTLEVKVSANGTEYTINVDLYCHLAPDTCDKIIEYVNDGYYNGSLIYKMNSYSNQLMVGDLKIDGENIVQTLKPEIEGEFAKNGTVGSNLKSAKGYVGLWRSWMAVDNSGNKYKASNGMNTGRATWYLPTESISDYDDYFCVFAMINMEDTANLNAFNALTDVFTSSDNYTEYAIFYTGEYDSNKANDNYGLTFNCVKQEYYTENSKTEDGVTTIDDKTVFSAEKEELVCFNKQVVKISANTKIVSISVK